MPSMLDENGIEYAIYNNRYYYNMTYASAYIGMTDTGFRRKLNKIKADHGITIPLIRLPFTAQNVCVDRRILDVFRKAVKVGKEQEWVDELRRVVNIVDSED